MSSADLAGVRWYGLVALLNQWTVDGRRIEKMTHRELPLPLTIELNGTTEMAGTIDTVTEIVGWAQLTTGRILNPAAYTYLMRNGAWLQADVDQIEKRENQDTGGVSSVFASCRLTSAHLGARPTWPQTRVHLLIEGA